MIARDRSHSVQEALPVLSVLTDFAETREQQMPTETAKTVAQIAIENPEVAREFEKLGVDYCCGG